MDNYIVTEISADEFEHVVLETREPVRPEFDPAFERLMRDIMSAPYAVTYSE